ncbi:MAG: hypothetical protein ACK4S4_03825 [Pyrinomonadaceae bacterium]
MSNDFDSNIDFDFDDEFEDDLEAFDEFDGGDDEDDPALRTAVLQKNNMIALLCLKTATEGAAICRVDPREARPAVQLYDDPRAAIEWFTRSLRTSQKNGWQLIYDGLPLQG